MADANKPGDQHGDADHDETAPEHDLPPESELEAEPEPAPELLYPGVIAEIDRLQNRKTSWVGAIITLVISLGLFLGVGLPGQSSFSRLLALIPILLFHESGHYVAMRIFGYRNLRMFFIPGFGAAVSGSHYNVPGWKQAVVALMGPLPGIVIGIVLGVSGMAFKAPLAIEAGFLTVVLNGFNLLPILPFDGGRVVHTVLFSRHPALDVVFRICAAVALGALGVAMNYRVFLFLGVFMVIAIPHALKVARVVRALRLQGIHSASDDSQTIPTDTAEHIITALKEQNARPVNDKFLAQQTLQVFENLNTRPPGPLASIGLLSLHALGFIAAALFGFLFLVAQRGPLQNYARAVAERPKHKLVAADVRHTEGPDAPHEAPHDAPHDSPPAAEHSTVVATFPTHALAQHAYGRESASLQQGETLTLLGDTILVRLPASDDAARVRWLDKLQHDASDAFVDGAAMHADFRFHAVAPDETTAKAIAEELETYFNLPLIEHCTPPWFTPSPLTPQQILARSTYSRLHNARAYDDPAFKELQKSSSEARRRGDAAAAKAIESRLERSRREIRTRKLEEIASGLPGAVDSALAREYITLAGKTKYGDPDKAGRKALAPRLGTAAPQSPADAACALSGYSSRTTTIIQIDGLTFVDPADGATALGAWLASRGCRTVNYDVIGEEGPAGFDYNEDSDTTENPD